MDSENREDAVVPLGERKSAFAVVDVGADCEDARNAGLGGALDRLVDVVEGGEVRVRVDHVPAVAGSSIRGKSGLAASIPSTSSATPLRTRSQARSSDWL